MKSSAITRIIIWSIILIALLGVLILSLFPWLVRDSFLYDNPPAETAIPVPLATEVGPIQALPNEEEMAFPADITEIEIDWVAGDIIIMEKDVEQITVSESDVSDPRYSLQYQLRDNKLEILFCEDFLRDGFGISLGNEDSKDLYIEVPKNWDGRSIEIDAAAANVEIHRITLRELDIDGAIGTCDLQDCHISDLDIDNASGDIYFSGTLDSLDFDAASASFIADFQNTPSRIDMDSMSGKLDIALPEDCGFTVSMEGMSSRLSSDFYGTETKNGSHVYGDGRCRINVDGMSCDVTIRKLDTIAIDPTAETAVSCTEPSCTDPTCTEHGHTAEECTDQNCALHHTEENCTDAACTIHSHLDNTHIDHNDGHKT